MQQELSLMSLKANQRKDLVMLDQVETSGIQQSMRDIITVIVAGPGYFTISRLHLAVMWRAGPVHGHIWTNMNTNSENSNTK